MEAHRRNVGGLAAAVNRDLALAAAATTAALLAAIIALLDGERLVWRWRVWRREHGRGGMLT
jgi:hypothetical protein